MIRRNAIATLILAAAAAAAPLHARDGATLLEERFKAALNGMVREVEALPDPAAKRESLRGFTARMDEGLGRAMAGSSLEAADRATVTALQARFQGYRAELEGREGFVRVPDADLDGFAAYIQQDLEQAPVGGGIYISAGALIFILLVLLLLF